MILPSESLTVSAYQFIAFHQEIHCISKCNTSFNMLLDGLVVVKWRVVKCQAVMVFQQIR
ncbi:hypothetical protein OA43_11700 [Klebsiella variicola]|nr:hypothetical protein OA43_11700 [Klebsiella variicola]